MKAPPLVSLRTLREHGGLVFAALDGVYIPVVKDRVRSLATVDYVHLAVVGVDGVVAAPAKAVVRAGDAIGPVCVNSVIAPLAVELVATSYTPYVVVARAAVDSVITVARIDSIVAPVGVDGLAAV